MNNWRLVRPKSMTVGMVIMHATRGTATVVSIEPIQMLSGKRYDIRFRWATGQTTTERFVKPTECFRVVDR